MPKAAKSHITSSSTRHRDDNQRSGACGRVSNQSSWDAYHGADCEALDLKHKGKRRTPALSGTTQIKSGNGATPWKQCCLLPGRRPSRARFFRW